MRSFRFLLSRRWAGFALAVVVLAYGTWWLGSWQFDRLAQRKASNEVVRTNEHATPAPVGDVLSPAHAIDAKQEWRRVTATGTYDTSRTIIWRYRSGDHTRNGVDVVVPLVTSDGTVLLVDRGWLSTDDQDKRPRVPEPRTGTVTITGFARVDATGDSTELARFGDGLSTRALSSRTVARHFHEKVYSGFVDLEKESPTPVHDTLEKAALPELDNGPHFFYGLQWWFFGILAVGGFFYLMYDERRSLLQGEDPAEKRQAAQDEKKARKSAKNAKRQAVKAAYQAAYDREKAKRDKIDAAP
ncbi:MAG: SURF1 family protein [Nocardioides sp.]|nr:SURF1 family protein [Nocardioides sp.]